MQKAYMESFVSLTKQFVESDDTDMNEFVAFTYKELLKKFLDGSARQVLPFPA